jgi:hypothetical protein
MSEGKLHTCEQTRHLWSFAYAPCGGGRWHGRCTRRRLVWRHAAVVFGRGGAHAQHAATCGPTRAGRVASHGCRLSAGCGRARDAAQSMCLSLPSDNAVAQPVQLTVRGLA